MKQAIVVALSFVVLLVAPMRSATANGVVDFRLPTKVAQVDPSQKKVLQTEAIPGRESPPPSDRSATAPTGAIDFQPAPRNPASNAVRAFRRPNAAARPSVAELFLSMFRGGSNSLVAKAVGSAEGTRTPDGGKTWAYYGHTDPGNGHWNLGSFSYQHGASSPEDADERQLARLQRQFSLITQIAETNGLQLNLEEKLNAIDLANQAPLAALDQGGYVDRLRQAYAEGLQGSAAVLRARTFSFFNPQTNRWEAPGLGNTESSIRRDQRRRQAAIYEALQLHQEIGEDRPRDPSLQASVKR
jgi:hypothetical protein